MAPDRRLWIAVGALAVLGLALRVAAAQGALWLDEAWSAAMAHDAATPLGVLLRINHDNNHHLNSLWLQLVGIDAPPVLQRALSIATGTAAIVVAALVGRRQGAAAALVAALLFAVSPLLVTYGAEARGYAPMLLALLVAVLLTARWLDDPGARVPAVPLALASLLGTLAQLTMVFGLAALALWVVLTLLPGRPHREAIRSAARVLVPVLLPAVAVVAMVLAAGLRFGNVDRFTLAAAAAGVGGMLVWTLGIVAPVVLAILAWHRARSPSRPGQRPQADRVERCFQFAAFTVLIPILFQLPNSGMARYHMVAGMAVLMLVALELGHMWVRGGTWRAAAAVTLAVMVGFMLERDLATIRSLRADPGLALAAMQARAPAGTDAAVDRPRASAVLRAAAASRGHALTIVEAPCPPTRFLFVDRDGDEPFPDAPERCGARYGAIAQGHPEGLSGTHWRLYERAAPGAQ